VPDSEVIAAVSKTLEELLKAGLLGLSTVELRDLQDNISPANPLLTVFLFEVGEDPSARNRPMVRGTSPPNLTLKKPPMALLLRYMLTPWGGDSQTHHKILGRAMQVLYDHPILSGVDLFGNLKDTDQAIKITLAPLDLEERTRVWFSVQKPYRLSVSYEARVVNLDSQLVDQMKPVARRSVNYAEPEE
jgi:hypothetical protein